MNQDRMAGFSIGALTVLCSTAQSVERGIGEVAARATLNDKADDCLKSAKLLAIELANKLDEAKAWIVSEGR